MTPTDLRTSRQALGLTQQGLAEALGVSPNTIARWERGEMAVQHPAIVRLALERLTAAQSDSA